MAFIPGGSKIRPQTTDSVSGDIELVPQTSDDADDAAELWEKQNRHIESVNLKNQQAKPLWGSVADPSTWLRNLNNHLFDDLTNIGKAYGISPAQISQIYMSNIGSLNDYLVNKFLPDQSKYASLGGLGPAFYTDTDAGAAWLLDYGHRWFESKISGLDFDVPLPGSGSGRGSSGSGSRGPTAEEIRNMYDLDQLATGASTLWRGWLLEDAPDPRGLARAYVDAIVKTGAEKEIDFTEFVRKQANKTARWASIYKGKPESMSEEQFLQPYFQAASQMIRPADAEATAIRGAQFGASGQEFQQMVNRDDSITGSSPYIAGLQQKMNQVSRVLKG